MFLKYQHIERYGGDETERINMGVCYIFPKLDGANSSIWLQDDKLCAGSRNRQLSIEADNAGFLQYIEENEERYRAFFDKFPFLRLYGEWLVPHTLKTYREEAWRRFWVFDVLGDEGGDHLSYESYAQKLDDFGLDYIEPLCKINDPSREQLDKILFSNTFLIQDGAGAGEGIVVKNYDYHNKRGDQKWAKLVRNEFKEENRRAFGVPELNGKKQIEGVLAEQYCTKAFVDKTRAKIEYLIRSETGEHPPHPDDCIGTAPRAKVIPRLLQTCFHDLVVEEIWDILKKNKNPTINFRTLQAHTIHWVKKHSEDLF